MKIKREILAFFLAILLFPLTCGFAFADLNVGDYSLGGYLELGGGFLADYPNAKNTGYLVKYSPFPVGPLGGVDLTLKSKDELEYYRFRMSNPGFNADQDYLLQIGKLGVYHVQAEYDQFQHVYSTVNPFNDSLGILIQRMRFSGDYEITPWLDLFVEDQWLRRTGQRPATYETGPPNGLQYTTYTWPIGYSQNDAKVGAEYDSKTYQFRLGYHLSTFEDDTPETLAGFSTRAPAGPQYVSLPPSNMANYINAEGGANLAAYKTRITGSFTYGWLSENESVYNEVGTAFAGNGFPYGPAGLSATTVNGDISGVTRPIEGLDLRYSYKAYDFQNNNLNNSLLLSAFGVPGSQLLLQQEQYSWLRQTVNMGAGYKVNDLVALDAAYTFSAVDRTENQGNTSSNSPQFGIRLFPTSWLNLIANYAYSERLGNDFLSLTPGNLLTYKFYAGDDRRNVANFVAEAFPLNNVTFSANFSFYNDNYNDSNAYGLLNDQGWSGGGDVSWTPTSRVALSLGYDHSEDITKERVENQAGLVQGTFSPVFNDWGPILSTLDSYDTFTARADFKLIPDKLKFTTGASYSFSSSHFDNPAMSHLNEAFADISAGLSYKFNEHWGVRGVYRLEIFNMSKAYENLFLTGTPTATNQSLNTLDGFYRNATANVIEGFVQYKF
ncbi:MAG: MtrB/PioB family outer membrane beta-barrel protein [Desulfobaccales bacterium]